mmetsp:Transcript_12851/g.27061  ORF Transcript_12851/g.27061 Transcript_12851/m.27061 type:complete len:495 (-) Transcript_12851:211-1695(-)
MRTASSHLRRKDAEARWVAILFLLGGTFVATVPRTIESFPLFHDVSSLSRSSHGRNAFSTLIHSSGKGPKKTQRTIGISKRRSIRSTSTLLSAYFSLTTALESLWEKRIVENLWKKQVENGVDEETDDYRCLSWLDLEDSNEHEDTEINEHRSDDTTISTLPLYPINDVYLPSAVNHTLYNVEPQNIQMALNLLSEHENEHAASSSSPRFCVVLRARDTGRIASTANILRIVDADVQKIPGRSAPDNDDQGEKDEDDISNILRICLTCQSEGLAEIQSIENGSGWAEKRVLRSKEYLRAKVRQLRAGDNNDDGSSSWRDTYNAIRKDLRTIKVIYQLQLSAEEFPPDTLLRLGDAMRDFPELEEGNENSNGEELLWEMAQEWQSVCMTLRQGTEAWLSADRNEMLVAAARAKGGGILKLPIHLSELDPEDRKDIQRLDQEAQEKHKEFGMDPILDFQVLIGLPTTNRKFVFLAQLVNRERRRLEDIASSYSSRS